MVKVDPRRAETPDSDIPCNYMYLRTNTVNLFPTFPISPFQNLKYLNKELCIVIQNNVDRIRDNDMVN